MATITWISRIEKSCVNTKIIQKQKQMFHFEIVTEETLKKIMKEAG